MNLVVGSSPIYSIWMLDISSSLVLDPSSFLVFPVVIFPLLVVKPELISVLIIVEEATR